MPSKPRLGFGPHRAFAALALASLSLFACGGQSNSDAHGGGSGGNSASAGRNSGGRSDSGGSAAGNAGGSLGGHATSGGASTGGATCAASSFADDQGWSVSVVIRNESKQTLHLGQATLTCGVGPFFKVEDAAGTPLPDLGDCRQPCESVVKGGGVGCPAICRFPEAITLAPGEGTSTLWSGLFRTTVSVPVQCLPTGHNSEPLHCDRAQQIEPGRFRFIARAGTDLDCSSTIGTCGACEMSSVGGCRTSAALVAGKSLSAETTVELGGGYGVGPDVGNGMPYPVEIFFKD